MNTPNYMEQALAYADRGWRVLPVGRDKRPLMNGWPEYATTDRDTIRVWWTNSYRNAGVGITTGAASGIVVIDIDPRHDGPAGLDALERQHGKLPATVTVRTGGGGLHLYLKYPAGATIRNKARLSGVDGVDVRGEGGYVVAPPTIHDSGQAYEWLGEISEPAELPAAWVELLAAQPSREAPAPGPSNGQHRELSKRTLDFIVNGCHEGERNDRLFKAAADMAGCGYTADEARARLLPVARQIGTSDDEAERTIGSAYAKAREPAVKPSAQPTDSAPRPRPAWSTIREIGARPAYGAGLPPITTGFAALDAIFLGGFRPESTYVLAGRTGTSKSTLALNIARRVALDGHPVLVFKLEESIVEATWRIHAAASQVWLTTLLNGASRARPNERERLDDGWSLIRDLPIRLCDERDIEAIEGVSREHAHAEGRLIIVDQISMVEAPGEKAFERATLASNRLRRLARDLRIPILIVSQVNRVAAKKKKDALEASDLRDSGHLENDAAGVILVDRVEKHERPLADWGPARYLRIYIGKNRYGPTVDETTGPLRLLWWPALARVDDAPRGSAEDESPDTDDEPARGAEGEP